MLTSALKISSPSIWHMLWTPIPQERPQTTRYPPSLVLYKSSRWHVNQRTRKHQHNISEHLNAKHQPEHESMENMTCRHEPPAWNWQVRNRLPEKRKDVSWISTKINQRKQISKKTPLIADDTYFRARRTTRSHHYRNKRPPGGQQRVAVLLSRSRAQSSWTIRETLIDGRCWS